MKAGKKFHLKFSTNSQSTKGGRKSDSRFIKNKIAYRKIAYINNLIENVEQLIVVVSLKQPYFNSGLLDRFLVLASMSQVKSILIITKIDLATKEELKKVLKIYEKINLPYYAVNNFQLKIKEELIEKLFKKKISAVVGHSGVGKTSLLNQIDPSFKEKVAEVSQITFRGKHTTKRIRKHEFSFEGAVYDMPGLKEIGYIHLAKGELKNHYPEFNLPAEKCYYKNCQHFHEPNCVVKENLNEDSIHPIRYKNYINILKTL